MNVRRAAALALAVTAAWGPARAQDADARRLRFEVHGYFLAAFGARLTQGHPAGAAGGDDDLLLGEGRLRLDAGVTTASGRSSLRYRGDLWLDVVQGGARGDVRELYVSQRAGALDLGVGRQIVTWGLGDLVFVNDVFPKDWESFFAGRPMEYLKLGVDGLRAKVATGSVSSELLVISSFTPDRLPSASRFVLEDPFGGAPRHEQDPGHGLSGTEVALRVQTRAAGNDLSVYGYRGYWRTPSPREEGAAADGTIPLVYPPLDVLGASFQRSLGAGVLGVEAGYYDSRRDRGGADPRLPNSQARVLVAYQLQPAEDLAVTVQIYGERMSQHGAYEAALPPGSPRQAELRSFLTARLTQFLAYQAWKLSLFGAYGLADGDYLLRSEATFRLTDDLNASLGATVMGGSEDATLFAPLGKNDNVFALLRVDF